MKCQRNTRRNVLISTVNHLSRAVKAPKRVAANHASLLARNRVVQSVSAIITHHLKFHASLVPQL